MLLWTDDQRSAVRLAVADAVDGHSTTIAVVGGPGTGKTALLDEITARAHGFRLLDAYGSGSGDHPFDLLAQWDIEAPASRMSPMVAAQSLRRLLDSYSDAGPVLIRIDDLQDADPESIEALVWLLRRATGDRLLVAAGHRPLAPGQHPAWRRWLDGHGAVRRVELTGLTESQAVQLTSTITPELPTPVAQRLWKHTAGNPLYLRALLEEQETEALTTDSLLPAPAEYVHGIEQRLIAMTGYARDLLRAVAVLDDGWVPLFDAVQVAVCTDASAALQELLDHQLLHQRVTGRGVIVRIPQTLLRSAILHSTGRPQLRVLHERAATAAVDVGQALGHRVAAAEQYDEDLALALDRHADDLHLAGRYRAAAHVRRSGAALTADQGRRRKRSVEAVFDQLLGRDLDIAAADRTVIDEAELAGRVVTGLRLILLGRWYQAYRLLVTGPQPTGAAAGDDDLLEIRTAYRHTTLAAWAGIGCGAATADVAGHLAAAAAWRSRHPATADPAMAGYERSPRGYIEERRGGLTAALESVAGLPADAGAVDVGDTVDLARRGVLRLRIGSLPGAISDLDEVQRRYRSGVIDITDGGYLARHAQALWLHGSWDRARSAAELALADTGRFAQPVAASCASVLPASAGDFERADELLDSARSFLSAQPWEEGRRSLLVAEVVRLHAGGLAADQGDYARRHADLFAQLERSASVGLLEAMHAAVALVWADEPGRAARFNDRVLTGPDTPRWAAAVHRWIAGLIAQRQGRSAVALRHFDAAVNDSTTAIPLYRAHMLADRGRAAAGAGRRDGALSLRQAGEVYESLGAVRYAATVMSSSARSPGVAMQPPPAATFRWQLSDRERQVLVLVAAGLSYAQVAAELFITQSTVAFHLSNMYAKTGVGSRHQLTALVRRDPVSFGVLPVAIGLPA